MMNRNVLQRQMFANGGVAQAAPAIAAAGAAQAPMVDSALEQAGQVANPDVVQQMLATASEGLQTIDSAEDFEGMMNSIRGDEASIEARYDELAAVVGPEDAAQTPESVLALIQPVMMLNAVDQGIGELAQAEMAEPVEGDMAGGIMSTIPQPEPTPMPMEGPPPVNFNKGGLVRRGDNQPVKMMQEGGDPFAQAGRLGELYKQREGLYTSILGDPTADLEKQKNLTQAQMLFDIANTALTFAAPMEGERRGMSPAERLAYAARTTQLPQTIGARAQAQLDKEAAAKAQRQQLKLSALGAAETGLAAEAKAASELKKQELIGAQDLAKLELGSKLDTARQRAIETLKQQGASDLETQKQAGRVALEGVQQENRVAIEKLEQSGSTADIVLADKLKKENMEIQANIDLGKMGVANEYDLAKMDKAHEQATELNNTNNALKEKLSGLDRELDERRLKLDTIKAEVDRAQGQRKIDLQEQALAMEADMNEFEKGYKTDKLALEEAAARLTRLGSNTNARITTLLSDTERLAKYAAGTLDKDETLEMNQAIAYYNAPKTAWSEEKKDFVIVPGNPLSNELLSSIQMRQDNGLTIPNIKFEGRKSDETVAQSPAQASFENQVTKGLTEPMTAFGSIAAGKNLINNLFEFVTASAPYKPEKSAINAAKTLNQNFLQVFQKSAELRESVFQAKLLQELTPSPTALFTGPEASADKINKIVGMIDNATAVLQNKLDSLPLDSKEYKDAKTYIMQMNQLKDGYGVFLNAYNAKQQGFDSDNTSAARKMIFGK